MIGFVHGILEELTKDCAVLDVNGFGINVNISTSTASFLPPLGEEVKLYTYTCVREDSFSLYGFSSKDELELFKKLITVNGIGPKGGLSLLSAVSADDLRFAILSGDVKLISSAPGIGKKTAERVVLDLKDKLSWNADLFEKDIVKNTNINTVTPDSGIKKEAVAALVALGYSSADAHKAVNSVNITDDMDSEAILKDALKALF